MGETDLKQQGTPPAAGQSSVAAEGTTSTPQEATYTRAQAEQLKSDALTDVGRKHKTAVDSLTKERNEAQDTLGDYNDLKKRYDDLASKDPEVFNLSKKEAELRDRERKLVSDARLHSDRIKRADVYERDVIITKIVGEYEGGDLEKLKGVCNTVGSSVSEEQMHSIASTLWAKKLNPLATPPPVAPAAAPPAKPYSGMTSGGQDNMPESAKGKIRPGWDELHK